MSKLQNDALQKLTLCTIDLAAIWKPIRACYGYLHANFLVYIFALELNFGLNSVKWIIAIIAKNKFSFAEYV